MDRRNQILTYDPAFVIARDHAAALLEEAERERLRRAAAGTSSPRRAWWRSLLPDLRPQTRPAHRPSAYPLG